MADDIVSSNNYVIYLYISSRKIMAYHCGLKGNDSFFKFPVDVDVCFQNGYKRLVLLLLAYVGTSIIC